MYNKGDKVTIVPNDTHLDHVKEKYNKVLTIERVIPGYTRKYKVSGVKDYALDSDLEPVCVFSIQIRKGPDGYHAVNPSNTVGIPAPLLMDIMTVVNREVENYNLKNW